jgi:pimeloyl-ACP methyl ester carboxylesterase
MHHHGAIGADKAATDTVELDGAQVAYRAFGAEDGTPLLFCHRFRGTIDDWDPLFVDTIAQQRPVVLFDSAGVGRSGGTTPNSIEAMARIAVNTARALELQQIDILGWSMGGAVAQHAALLAPTLVRRLVLAGTGPGGVPDAPSSPPRVAEIAGKPTSDVVDDDLLYLFFHRSETSRALGKEHLARLNQRSEPPGPAVKEESYMAQLHALITYTAGEGATIERLGEIHQPTLVANGHHDVMVHAYNSYLMSQQLPSATLVLYPDAGHGFLFQLAKDFGQLVTQFLTASSDTAV